MPAQPRLLALAPYAAAGVNLPGTSDPLIMATVPMAGSEIMPITGHDLKPAIPFNSLSFDNGAIDCTEHTALSDLIRVLAAACS